MTIWFNSGEYGKGFPTDSKCYRMWYEMCRRCYDWRHKDYTRYGLAGITVCDDWLDFQKFAEFYYSDHYRREGYHLDKDLAVLGNTVYSPETCAFIPHEINTFLTLREKDRGEYPLGVTEKRGKFYARVCMGDYRTWEGPYETANLAHDAYISRKISQARVLALRYDGELDGKIIKSLLNMTEDFIEGAIKNVK